MIQGLSERLTKSGIPVLRLHYSADPNKRPGTEAGDKWLAEALQGYPGGMRSARWKKELEIDYGALGGTKLFPEWEQWSANGKVCLPVFHPTGYQLYGSYDHGWRHPACYLVHGISGDGHIVTLWEFYASQVPVSAISKLILGQNVTLPDGRRFVGNPYAGQETYKVADPSIWAEDQIMSDNTMKSVAKLFLLEKVYFTKGERGGDTMVAEWLHGHYLANPEAPLYRITRACPNLIREIGLQRHKELSPQVAKDRAQPEQWVDKDNDAWDSLKYFLQRFPPRPESERAEAKPASFAWWRKQAQLPEDTPAEARPSFSMQRECIG